jgi:hypothetical protein
MNIICWYWTVLHCFFLLLQIVTLSLSKKNAATTAHYNYEQSKFTKLRIATEQSLPKAPSSNLLLSNTFKLQLANSKLATSIAKPRIKDAVRELETESTSTNAQPANFKAVIRSKNEKRREDPSGVTTAGASAKANGDGNPDSSCFFVTFFDSHNSQTGSDCIDTKTTLKSTLSVDEIEQYATSMGIKIKNTVVGPSLRLDAFRNGDESQKIGYLTAFVRPGVFHLDTIQVQNRRQVMDFKRDGWKVDGPGMSFLLGSWAICWARDNFACKRAQLLAVNDSEIMHRILVKLYTR